MKYIFIIIFIGVSYVLINFALPPYAIQSFAYFSLNKDKLNEFDAKFIENPAQKANSGLSGLKLVFKTKMGARLYSIGSEKRFDRYYNVSFIKGGLDYPFCSPMLIYSNAVDIKCNIELSDGWVLYYNGIIRHRLNELVEIKI